ncbi:MAG TPA: type II toxin-antitoxin system VapC family toxin [Solirubrobacterales bacterium]
MRLLLDTQVLIWVLANPERLPAATADALETYENQVLVSVASPWEISIKTALGKLPPIDDLELLMADKHFELLPISLSHTAAVASLPHHHRDPFDRMLIAQAQVEGLTLVTSDREIRRYPVSTLPAV